MIIERINGDVTNPIGNNILIPHVCNDIGAWGSGVVIAISKKWPAAREAYLDSKLKLGKTEFIAVERIERTGRNVIIANMTAQSGLISIDNPQPLVYEKLKECMEATQRYIKYMDVGLKIHAPKFGSERAGGDWNIIEGMIEDIWKDIDTTIYTYP